MWTEQSGQKERTRGMKKIRAAAAVLTAAVLMSAGSMTAFASSPEFARTAEEWASLQDNRLEYGEIEGLVEEYNPIGNSGKTTATPTASGPTSTGGWQMRSGMIFTTRTWMIRAMLP